MALPTPGPGLTIAAPNSPRRAPSLAGNIDGLIHAVTNRAYDLSLFNGFNPGGDITSCVSDALTQMAADGTYGCLWAPPGFYTLAGPLTWVNRVWLGGPGFGIAGAAGSERGTATIKFTNNGDGIRVPKNFNAGGLFGLTLQGTPANTLQDIIKLNPGGAGSDVCGPFDMDHVDIINSGRDGISGFGFLNCDWNAVRVNLSGRYGLYASGGYCNTNDIRKFQSRLSVKSGIKWTGAGFGTAFYTPTIESNNSADSAAEGGFYLTSAAVDLHSPYLEANGVVNSTKSLWVAGNDNASGVNVFGGRLVGGSVLHDSGFLNVFGPSLDVVTNGCSINSGSAVPPMGFLPQYEGIHPPIIRRAGVDYTLTPGGFFSGRELGGGQRLASTDFAVVGGSWGGAGLNVSVAGTDSRFTLVITAGAAPSANPEIDLTFKDGTWTTAPSAIGNMGNNTTNATDTDKNVTVGCTALGCSIIYRGTPTAGRNYEMIVDVRG